ncbi:MAG: hypothetical protein C0514_07085 [Candidatus Puniceispirillum sp.]|nr:hypothetical protein [Candidatus Puniceispirillum sp.]
MKPSPLIILSVFLTMPVTPHAHATAQTGAACPHIAPDSPVAQRVSLLSDRAQESFQETVDGKKWLVTHEESKPMTIGLFGKEVQVTFMGLEKGACVYHLDEPAFSTLFTMRLARKTP